MCRRRIPIQRLKYKTKLVHLTFALIFRLGALRLLIRRYKVGNTFVLAIVAQKWTQWANQSLWEGVSHLSQRVKIGDVGSKFQVLKILKSESGWGQPPNLRFSLKELIFERLIIFPDCPENLSKKYSRRKKLGPINWGGGGTLPFPPSYGRAWFCTLKGCSLENQQIYWH